MHIRLVSALVIGVVTCVGAHAGDSSAHPTLTLPDGSTITLPEGTKAFGPNGPALPQAGNGAATDRPPAESGKAEPPSSAASRHRQRLDDLFARLAGAQDATEAAAITTAIDHLWLQSGSPTADLLMQRAAQALEAKDDKTASLLLDKIIALKPGWAEAWNKRATVRYLEDDDGGSMADIAHVLALEPRHFGALSGMGFILHRNGNDKAALTVLRKAAQVNPQQSDIKTLIDELTPAVDGQAL